jgi:CHAT domain-containing protein
LLPLLKQANFKNIYYCEREASRLQKKSAKIEEKPYEHPYHWAAFTITGNS